MLTLEEVLAGEARSRAVSGLYRNTRQDDFFWFAFRSPRCWAELDAATRSNGALHVDVGGESWGFLIVDGAVAVKSPAAGPGYRRLHAMVEPELRTQAPAPTAVEPAQWEGRQAIRCQWQDGQETREALFDAASGLVVRTLSPEELVELTELRFDDSVPDDVFVPPKGTLDRWRGGTAYVQHDPDTGLYLAAWEPRSGPGGLHLRGPEGVSLEVATDWARTRTDDVRVSETRPRS